VNKFLLLLLFTFPCWASSQINLELGQVENTYNKVKISGDVGTRFNLAPSFDDVNFYYRLSFSHKFKSRHGFRLLYAPLKITGDRSYSDNINFQGVQFNANENITTEYQFNSYRGSYFYQLIDEARWIVRIGATLKVRDAKVELKQGSTSKFKKNTGLVPLFYLFSEYKWDHGFRIAFDFDGLAAPQGRAFDIGLMLGKYILSSLHINIGYRVLEGGVDNEKVYNFSQFNYLFTSIQYDF
jgi:hypothetical protein